jgi:hypothetical protein
MMTTNRDSVTFISMRLPRDPPVGRKATGGQRGVAIESEAEGDVMGGLQMPSLAGSESGGIARDNSSRQSIFVVIFLMRWLGEGGSAVLAIFGEGGMGGQ